MKKTTLFKTVLLLFALIVGSNAWADTSTVNASKVTSSSASWTGSAEETWSVSVNGGATNQNVTSGYAQVGTRNSPSTSITFSTSGITGTISSIVVDCASYNGIGTISATVGANAFGTQSQSIPSWSNSAGGNITFSGSASGEISITMTNGSGGRAMYIKSITVTYSASSKLPHGLSWSAASKDVTYNATPYNLPTLTNPHSLAITYNSSNTSVATIDSDGNVTVKNETGSTTITASTEGDETYAAGSVSYTLNVTRVVILEDGVFNFSYTVAEGGGYSSGASQDNDIKTESSTWTSGNIVLTTAIRYSWYNDGTLRLYKETGTYDASTMTLTCPSGYVITQIDFTGVTGTGALSNLVAASGSYSVDGATATWTGAAPSVTFSTPSNSAYIKKVSVTYVNQFSKEVSSVGYATYVAPYDIVFPNDDAYIVTSVGDKVVLSSITEAPAGTPLILKGAGTKTATVLTSTPATLSSNLLDVSDGSTKGGNDDYVLYKDDTNPVGFYKWNGGWLSAGKVYLPGDEVATAREFLLFDDGETTGISTALMNNERMNNEVYNLNGQRVAQPNKGLYIVNGKKVIIK